MINEFNLQEEFEGLDFKSKRLEERFKKTIEKLSEKPDQSIWLASGSRSEAKAVYRMLGNDKTNDREVLRVHRESTKKRLSKNPVILAVQDTMGVNYHGHKKTEGMGYNCEQTLGINVHSCLAVTPEGLVLGLLEQKSYTRPERKDDSASHDKKKLRPIEEKESFRWLKTMETSTKDMPEGVKIIHICDREGDMYELFEKALKTSQSFLIRVVHNRMTMDNEKVIDAIKKEKPIGEAKVIIPRDSRKNIKERNALLEVSYKNFDIKKSKVRAGSKHLSPCVNMNVIYIKEKQKDKSIEPIEWILATNEPIESVEDALEMVGYYIQRWKIERFHYTLKSGCKIEKIQERSVEKIFLLIMMYSIISARILHITYLARVCPDEECSIILNDEEWKLLYCVANKKNRT